MHRSAVFEMAYVLFICILGAKKLNFKRLRSNQTAFEIRVSGANSFLKSLFAGEAKTLIASGTIPEEQQNVCLC